MTTPRTLVLIPTYDERESLPKTLERLFAANPGVDALVIDDASPDGTGALADEWAQRDHRMTVLHRSAKDGLGAAYLAGFSEGIARGYDILVEMDADGSHPPETLPEMLRACWEGDGAELVIGSRWIRGGRVVDWPVRREALSRLANGYARLLLGMGVRDATAGFRAYRTDAIASIDRSKVDSAGYCFQIDMTMRVIDAGGRVLEVPIEFREREHGVSKMSGGIIGEAMIKVTGWGLGRRAAQVSALR